MKTNYIKQAWVSLRQQPVVSIVSIIGTALAIFLIMLVVMIDQVKYEPFAPESNRDRWLVQRFGSIGNTEWGDGNSNGPLGFNTIKQTLYRMETPEAVTAFVISPETATVSVANQAATDAQLMQTDDGFWRVFDFTVLSGKPFSKEDFDSGLPKAVITKSMARRLFGTTDAVGRDFSINYTPYTVCAVVEDVSNLVSYSYADIWVPFTATGKDKFSWCGYMGNLSMVMLAKDKSDFPKIREEYDRLFAELDKEAALDGWYFIKRDRPYTQIVQAFTPYANIETDMDAVYRTKFIIFLILLIVPAVNLSSMTHSRLVRRREEIGVRRAFGAKRSEIIGNLFIESLVITFIAGIIGLLLSLVSGLLLGDMIFTPNSSGSVYQVNSITVWHLFHWSTFGLAMLFCFILNLLSATVPTISASRTNIVNALTGKG